SHKNYRDGGVGMNTEVCDEVNCQKNVGVSTKLTPTAQINNL
ncbi:MAG: hypothetical protein RL013_1658, partial [Bacteroidota bacterium]